MNKTNDKASEASFIVFGAPAIGEEEIAEVEACLRSGWLGTGPRVARFEADFAAYKDSTAKHVATVNSCTAASKSEQSKLGTGAAARRQQNARPIPAPRQRWSDNHAHAGGIPCTLRSETDGAKLLLPARR
ncbi:MAG: DegT/DnrJ/EryC1/StrS family aminotransferase [Azonexus sp.]|nr:DegT/DnrJ/EryC1/StrS family aminotransferase [Azonexus sp.]